MKKMIRSSRRQRRIAGVLAMVLCLSLLLGACGGSGSDAPELLDSVKVQAEIVTVGYDDVYDLVYEVGTILPYSEEVLFPVDGTLGSVTVIPGQEVKKGDVLAQLDLESMQEELDDLMEQLETAESAAEMTNTRLTLAYQQRKEELNQLEASGANSYAIDLKEIDVWEAWQEVEHAEQNQELEQKKLKNEVERLQEEMNEYGQLVAPFDGVVSWISDSAMEGAYFTEDTPLIAVSKPSDLYISTMRVQDSILKKCDRIYAQIGGEEYELTIRENDKDQDSADSVIGLTLTSKYDFVEDVDIDLNEVCNALVMFRLDYREQVLCVPTRAIHYDTATEKTYVYIDDNGERVRVDVEVGAETTLKTEIVSGLKEGDAVYVEG